MPSKPFLILTLRRTGGTSLMRFLAQISERRAVEHEPFNKDRQFGAVTRRFLSEGHTADLSTDIEEALTGSPPIKHCIDAVPVAVTFALIRACAARNYEILVLTRKNERKRLLSLFLAQSTGAWGSKMAARIYPEIREGQHRCEPIPVQKVAQRVRLDAAALGHTLRCLKSDNIQFEWLYFEDLYQSLVPVQIQAQRLAGQLGVMITDDDPRLEAFAEHGGQNSSSIQTYVPNFDALEKAINQHCPM